jgi:predicted  nucleic acid-binding Zn-ribbon protein
MTDDQPLEYPSMPKENLQEEENIMTGLTNRSYCHSMNDDIKKLREDIKELRRDMAVLTAKHESLRHDCDRGVTSLGECDDLIWKRCGMIDRDIKEIYDRVIHLEHTMFPNLQNDMDAVYRITGEGDLKRENPLDHRKPPPK